MADGFSFQFKDVKLYTAELDHYKNDPNGEVGVYLRKRGEAMIIAARRQVGVDTGALRDSIAMTHKRVGNTYQYIQIGSNLHYALAHHEGTKPHVIRPNNHQFLRFSSGGRVIYSRQVLHPGNRPNRFLSDQLILARV